MTKRGRTIPETAKAWGMSVSNVRRLIAQGRVKVKRECLGDRCVAVLVLDEDPPARVAWGSLTEEQRKAWPGNRRE